LSPGITPRLLATYEYGAKSTGAVFYGLAAGHVFSFFDLSMTKPSVCHIAVEETANGLSAWRNGSMEVRKNVSDVRASLLTNERREAIVKEFDLGWTDEFEGRPVQVKWGCIHSDFHGENVLLTAEGKPAVIDYGDVGLGAASIDPISLELSALFHPNSPWRDHVWPSAEVAAAWGEIDVYVKDCPYPEFVRACRKWASQLAVGRREMAASAYAYLMRQFKYGETNKERAKNILIGVRHFWMST